MAVRVSARSVEPLNSCPEPSTVSLIRSGRPLVARIDFSSCLSRLLLLTGVGVTSSGLVGALAGTNEGTIRRVFVSGTVSASSNSGR